MKKYLILFLVATTLLVTCGKKSEQKKGEESVTVKVYYTQPVPFSMVLSQLEALGNVNFNRILNQRAKPHPKTLDKISFNLGAGIADALVSLQGENKNTLMQITNELTTYAEVLGVSKEFLMLSDSLGVMLDNGEWNKIEQKLEDYKTKILDELYNMESFDWVIMIQYGGWIKGLEDVTNVIINDLNYDKEATMQLANKTVITALMHDLPNLSDEDVKTKKYFKNSYENVKEIKEIIFSSEDGYYSKDQVDQLYKLSSEITNWYLE
ncbi:MAG: hypothetical protein SVM86_00255 [Candidatus Cloacimonadota bacterium]|nr:hypothetical protein [Candidatus Cloacimonadota bacterium]